MLLLHPVLLLRGNGYVAHGLRPRVTDVEDRVDAPDDVLLTSRGLRLSPTGPDEVVVKRGVVELRLRFTAATVTMTRILQIAEPGVCAGVIARQFPDEQRAIVERIVTALVARGLLAPEVGDDPQAVFWRGLAGHAPAAQERLLAARVLVIGTGSVATALTAALTDCGVGLVDTASVLSDAALTPERPWDLCCAAADGSPEPGLTDITAAALSAGVVHLPVWLDDLVIHVGPLTHPYDTACLRCYLLRVDASDTEFRMHRSLGEPVGGAGAGAGFLPTMPAMAGQLAATEVVKQLAGLPVTTGGRIITMTLVPFRAESHRVLRVPRCPECSGTARQGAPVISLGSQL